MESTKKRPGINGRFISQRGRFLFWPPVLIWDSLPVRVCIPWFLSKPITIYFIPFMLSNMKDNPPSKMCVEDIPVLLWCTMDSMLFSIDNSLHFQCNWLYFLHSNSEVLTATCVPCSDRGRIQWERCNALEQKKSCLRHFVLPKILRTLRILYTEVPRKSLPMLLKMRDSPVYVWCTNDKYSSFDALLGAVAGPKKMVQYGFQLMVS